MTRRGYRCPRSIVGPGEISPFVFELPAAQAQVTAAYAGGRPQITVNNWTSSIPSPTSQPSSRSLTIGTYRGNNACSPTASPPARS